MNGDVDLEWGDEPEAFRAEKKFAPESYREQIVPANLAGSRSASTNIRTAFDRVNPVMRDFRSAAEAHGLDRMRCSKERTPIYGF